MGFIPRDTAPAPNPLRKLEEDSFKNNLCRASPKIPACKEIESANYWTAIKDSATTQSRPLAGKILSMQSKKAVKG